MTTPLREQFKNNPATTLNGAINNSVTSITVTTGSVFPSTGNFRLLVEDEIMLCTARSTNTLTVVRAYEGTTGASHADGKAITLILTEGSVDQLGKDNVPMWGYASVPPLNKLVADNGTTILTASDFTWDNQDTATATDQNGTIVLRLPAAGAGENVRVLTRTAPSAPYSYIAAFQACLPNGGSDDLQLFGFGFRQNSTGKLNAIAMNVGDSGSAKLAVYAWTDPTTFDTSDRGRELCGCFGSVVWFKIEDDNTNLKFYIGMDGVEWILIKSVPRTTHMSGGPDEVCFVGNNVNNADTEGLVRLVHWSRAS